MKAIFLPFLSLLFQLGHIQGGDFLYDKFCNDDYPYIVPSTTDGKVNTGELPFVAKIINHRTAQPFTRDCSGSLISQYWILTSAHCVDQASYLEVILGKVYFQTPTTSLENQVFFVTSESIRTNIANGNDAALLKLVRGVQVTSYVFPSCLPSSCNHGEIDGCEYYVSSVEGFTSVLERKNTIMRPLGHDNTPATSNTTNNSKSTTSTSTMTTTTSSTTSGNISSGTTGAVEILSDKRIGVPDCNRVSGAPLFCVKDGKNMIIGLISKDNRFDCDEMSLYQRICSILSWINSIVYEEFTTLPVSTTSTLATLSTNSGQMGSTTTSWTQYCSKQRPTLQVSNGELLETSVSDTESIWTLSCHPGYQVVRDPIVQCYSDQSFLQGTCESSTPFSCQSEVSNVEFGYITRSTTSQIGALRFVYCWPGYRIQGNDTIQCQESGQWSAPGRCIRQ